MTDQEWETRIESVDGATELLEELRLDWRERRDEQEQAVADASDLSTEQAHRGRRKALQYGVAWLDGGDLEDEPFEVCKRLCGRLAGAATNESVMGNATSLIGPKHETFQDELSQMTTQARDVRGLIQEEWGEQTDIDEIPWISEEIKEKAAKSWGYDV